MNWEGMHMFMDLPGRCCLCGGTKNVYHNPEPLRDAGMDCCAECNLLVRTARMRYHDRPEAEREQYLLRLRNMSYEELVEELKEDRS